MLTLILSLCGILLLFGAWYIIQKHLFNTSSGIPELHTLAEERQPESHRKIRGNVVIAGGRYVECGTSNIIN
jgi:hypothetical protein